MEDDDEAAATAEEAEGTPTGDLSSQVESKLADARDKAEDVLEDTKDTAVDLADLARQGP